MMAYQQTFQSSFCYSDFSKDSTFTHGIKFIPVTSPGFTLQRYSKERLKVLVIDLVFARSSQSHSLESYHTDRVAGLFCNSDYTLVLDLQSQHKTHKLDKKRNKSTKISFSTQAFL